MVMIENDATADRFFFKTAAHNGLHLHMAAKVVDFWPEFLARIEELDYVRTRYCNVLYMELFAEDVDAPTRIVFSRSLLRFVA